MNNYDKIYKQWYNFRKNTEVNKCIVEFTKYLKKEAKILDIGCGTGYPISSFLVEQGYNVTGIDISQKMIEKAQQLKLPNTSFLVSDFLDFHSSDKFDAVIAFDSLWYIPYDKQEKIYTKISSLMNIDGYFLFTHGKEDSSIVGKMFGKKFYYSSLNVNKVHQLLKNNGFSIISSIEDYQEKTTGSRDLIIIAKKVF